MGHIYTDPVWHILHAVVAIASHPKLVLKMAFFKAGRIVRPGDICTGCASFHTVKCRRVWHNCVIYAVKKMLYIGIDSIQLYSNVAL